MAKELFTKKMYTPQRVPNGTNAMGGLGALVEPLHWHSMDARLDANTSSVAWKPCFYFLHGICKHGSNRKSYFIFGSRVDCG